MLDLDDSDLHLLPPSMRWLVKTCGLPAVLLLVRAYGGGAPVYVPAEFRDDHPLLRLIGPGAFVALVAEYGGTTMEIARCKAAARELLRRQIRREAEGGASQNTLALRHGFTVRHIRNILEGCAGDDRQGGLF